MKKNRTKRKLRLGLLVASALIAASPSGCGKRKSGQEEGPESGSPSAAEDSAIGPQEADRGREACQSYVDQVCDCALKIADLTGECEVSRSRPKALEMNLRAAMATGNANERDRLAIQANARLIVRACIEDAAALVKRGCPISRDSRD